MVEGRLIEYFFTCIDVESGTIIRIPIKATKYNDAKLIYKKYKANLQIRPNQPVEYKGFKLHRVLTETRDVTPKEE